MVNENIISYLRQNKGKYSPEVLKEKLKGAGYPLNQIEEGFRVVYGDGPGVSSPEAPKTSFWDFKNVRVYRSTGEKIIDALFGFFVPILVISFAASFLGYYDIGLSAIPIQVVAAIYFWRKRRYIGYGLLVALASSYIFNFYLGNISYIFLNYFY